LDCTLKQATTSSFHILKRKKLRVTYRHYYIYINHWFDESRKYRKITHLREDNTEIKPGPPGWGFSVGLVTQSCRKVIPRILSEDEKLDR
jgi:hypothetical protein